MKVANKKKILRLTIIHAISRSPAFKGPEGYIDNNHSDSYSTTEP